MHSVVTITWKEQTDTILLPHWKSVAECMHAYLHSVDPQTTPWELINLDAAEEAMPLNVLVGELDLAAGTRLLMRSYTAHTAPTPRADPPLPLVVPPAASLSCRIELPHGGCKPLTASGLTIQRSWLAKHIPQRTRLMYLLRKRRSLLSYISRSGHCHIGLDEHTQQWILTTQRPLLINQRPHPAGERIQLAAGTTILQFGEGLTLMVHLAVELE